MATHGIGGGADNGTDGLRRDLGLLDAVGVGLGAVVGAGLFVGIGYAAKAAGPAFLLALALAGVAATCNGLSAAQLAAVYPRSGGAYEYGRRLLNPWAGFAAGWLFITSKLTAGAAVALGFAGHLAELFPAIPQRPVAVVAVLGIMGANLFGVRKTGQLNTVLVAASTGSLLVLAACLVPSFRSDRLRPFAPAGVSGILEAAAILFFAYTGFARVATLGEEVRDPARTIPRAVVLTLAISIVLYGVVGLATVGAVGAPELAAGAPAPLSRAADASGVWWLPGLVSAAGAAAMLGVLLSQILGTSRTAFAMAREGDLPRPLARVSAGTGIPAVAVVATGLIEAGFAAVGGMKAAVEGASFAILAYYGIMNAAALRLPVADRLVPRWVSWAGLAMCVGLAGSLKAETVAVGLAVLAAGLGYRWVVTRGSSGGGSGDARSADARIEP